MDWFRHRRERGRPRHPDILTPAEWRVLEHVREGATNAETAVRLGVSINTVRYHVSSMLAKLDLPDRRALAAWQGEPTEASRAALGRSPLAAPFLWLREALASSWAGKLLLGTGVVSLSAGAVFVISSLNEARDVDLDPPPATVVTALPIAPNPTATPAPTDTPVPSLNVPFPFTAQAVDITLVPNSDPDGFGQAFIYDLQADVLHRMIGAGASGRFVAFLQPSPHSDVLLAWTSDGTILYNLAQQTAQLILPVHTRVHRWLDEDRVLFTADYQQPGSPGAGWPAGLYELDLAAMTVTFRARLNWQQLLSPGGDSVVVVSERDDGWQVVVSNIDGSERQVVYETSEDDQLPGWPGAAGFAERRDIQPHVTWAPDSQQLLVIERSRARVVSAIDGTVRDLFEAPGEIGDARDRVLIHWLWSNDSRYVALTVGRAYETWIVDALPPHEAVGPFSLVLPVAWQPAAPRLLALSDFCEPDGFHPAILDATTGALSIEPAVSGVWYHAWSPDGGAVVAGTGTSVHVLDAATLAPQLLPPFGTSEENGRWVANYPNNLEWSASGRWLVGDVAQGRGRCE